MNLDQFETGESEELTPTHFILSLLQIRDQAHVNHWQTKLEAEHRNFGTFYTDFLGLVDGMVESILGKYGTDVFNFGEASIGLSQYNGNFMELFEMVDASCEIFCQVFDRDKDSELYNEMDNIKTLRNTITYLMNQQ